MTILLFFLAHWFSSLFSQTFFLHRYTSHRMFKLSPFWERFFYLLTIVTQGSSYLEPRAYGIMHRMHHAFSDTEKDPHSPCHLDNPIKMLTGMWGFYQQVLFGTVEAPENFDKDLPRWEAMDRFFNSPWHWVWRIGCGAGYTLFYFKFASPWMYFLIPVHYIMGPVHGVIVNWCGHRHGYTNFHDTEDHSRNTLPMDFLMMGELFQNNHHKYPNRVNFAVKPFELDPAYPLIKILSWCGIVRFPDPTEEIH
ncbi:acyl-CoA desaturase [Candidatus Poribacteria bacterium]|nr:acyl-CoA desaturase [Candidatus Poribacteria bacterium]